MKNIFYYFIVFCLIIHFISPIQIKDLNENSQLKIELSNNFYLTASIFINDKEYILPIDISYDRVWINKNENIDNNKTFSNFILEECVLYEKDIKRKKNIPISFFDKDILLEEIAFDEINFNYNTSCHTKKGIIGLSKKSEKKVYNLLTQLNQVYSLKRYFSIKNNELIIGNFDNALNNNKYLYTELVDLEYKWAFNLQGIYYGEIDKNNYKDDYFIINKMNDNYKKLNIIFEFNSLQKYIIIDYYYFSFMSEKIFKNKCNIKRDDDLNFEAIYCDKKTIETLPDLSFIINDKLLPVSISSLFIKTSADEYMFIIVFSELAWRRGFIIGNLFFNELGNNVIFDAENNHIYFLNDKIIDKIKIIDEYSIDDKQIILNNNNFSVYDFVLCFVLILNFVGIFLLLATLYKEKILNQMPNNIKKIKRLNK